MRAVNVGLFSVAGISSQGFYGRRRSAVSVDIVDRELNSGDLLGFLVGNLGLEFLFQRHDKLNGIQRIGAQIVDEGRAQLDIIFLDAQLLNNNFPNAVFYTTHIQFP